jgi:spore coat polysaccharide biosynthesis protein SpsF
MGKERVVASIEARMGSSRLPGKVLADVRGRPALSRLLARLKSCRELDGIVLATSTSRGDDVLEKWAEMEGVPCYRGSEEDVLQRVVEAQKSMDSDIVVEICGDMTLLDPGLIDEGVRVFLDGDHDVVTTTRKPSYPIGVDALVFSLDSLNWVCENIQDPEVREHVSLYFFQHPEAYQILDLLAPAYLEAPKYRFVLDYPEDLKFIRAVYERLEPVHGEVFGLEEILDLLKKEPDLVNINLECGNPDTP